MSRKNINKELFVVGIGSPVERIDALGHLVSGLEKEPRENVAVITQHVNPNHPSPVKPLLQRHTSWEVVEIKDGEEIISKRIYVPPPDKHLIVENSKLRLRDYRQDKPVPPIDRFFESLAEEKGIRAIGIILVGTGTDGTQGMQKIKNKGGYTLVQVSGGSENREMVDGIIKNGCYDKALLVQDMPNEITQYINNFEIISKSKPEGLNTTEEIFALLEQRTGTDFSKYKPSTIMRRINKRLEHHKISTPENYLSYIRQHPKELDHLFETVLIGVTEFFRDTEAFAALEEQLCKIIHNKRPQKNIRVWSVGTATGEEAYSIAILIAQLLKDGISKYNVQIFATDIDEKALKYARKGHYPYSVVEKLPTHVIKHYFTKTDTHYEIKKMIRQMVLFCKHDVTVDPPFVKVDLIVCRNVLIYFTSELQKEVLPVFYYALNHDGYLFLGKSENVKPREELFEKLPGKTKIFQRSPGNSHIYRLGKSKLFRPPAQPHEESNGEGGKSLMDLARETFFRHLTHPIVIINSKKEILEVKGSIRLYAELKEGETSTNIIRMVNPELSLELRALLSKAEKSRQPQKSKAIKFPFFEEDHFVRLHTYPIYYDKNRKSCYMILFEKVEPDPLLNFHTKDDTDELDSGLKILELEHELGATKEHLQLFTEELETSNEELQSLNEELQSTNEELKSANEELETSNEELQSINEELHTANQELHISNDELLLKEEALKKSQQRVIQSETLYKSLARNFPNGTISIISRNFTLSFIDGEELKRLNLERGSLIGKNVLSLYEPDEASKLKQMLMETFSGVNGEVVVKHMNNHYLTSAIPLEYSNGERIEKVICATQNISHQISLEESLKKALQENRMLIKKKERALNEEIRQQQMFNRLLMDSPAAICIFRGEQLIYEFINPICKKLVKNANVLGRPLLEVQPELKGTETERKIKEVLQSGEPFLIRESEVEYDKKGDGNPQKAYFTFVYSALHDAKGKIDGIINYGYDVTLEVEAKRKVEADIYRLQTIIESLPLMAWTALPDGSVQYFNKHWYEYTGQTWETAREGGWERVLDPEDLHSFKKIFEKSLDAKESFQTEVRYLRYFDRKFRWHIIRVVPVMDMDHQVKYWIGTAMDIHEQKEIELKKDEFLNIASHELKTPLTAISSYYQLMKESFPKNVELTRLYLDKTEKSIARISKLINELLNISRIDTGNLQLDLAEHDLNEVIQEVVALHKNGEDRIRVEGQVHKKVVIDRDRFLQVIENLISNAFKFSSENQPVTIRLEEDPGGVRICIEDSGIGISKEDQKNLFDRYFRVKHKTNVSGMGLGLYISYEIVRNHNGTILVESEPGRGSKFMVFLPTKNGRKK